MGRFTVKKTEAGFSFNLVADNNEIMYWQLQFRNLEGYELLPAACVAVSALAQAVKDGSVKQDEYIMLNCTGGGMREAMSGGYVFKQPDLVLSPDLPAEEVIRQVCELFE